MHQSSSVDAESPAEFSEPLRSLLLQPLLQSVLCPLDVVVCVFISILFALPRFRLLSSSFLIHKRLRSIALHCQSLSCAALAQKEERLTFQTKMC